MKNIKKIVILTIAAVVFGLMISTVQVSAQTGGDGANGAVSNSTDTSSLSTGGDNDNGTVSNSTDVSSLSTGGDNDNGSVSNDTDLSSLSTGGDNDNGAVSVETPSNPSNNGGSRSSSGRSGGSRVAIATTTPTVLGTSTFSCPLITTSMKLGWKNDNVEVAKLQAFLKNVEKLDVEVNGTFDQKTEDAVKAFQSKNLATTMGPWGATRPSGFVYITTGKVINQIACASPLTLSADELAIIEAYKNRPAVEVIGADGVNGSTGTSTASTTDEIGSEDSNVAGAAGASILSKFWNFIKNLFK